MPRDRFGWANRAFWRVPSPKMIMGGSRETKFDHPAQKPALLSERPITIDEVVEAARKGTLQEVWGTGTAAVISPVGELAYKGERIVVNGGGIGALTQKLYDTIVGIQYGSAPDPHGWTRPLGNRIGG